MSQVSSAPSLVCFHCQKNVPLNAHAAGGVGRRDECPHCRYDLHVCKNCQHYDSKVYNECRETSAEVVRDKEKANFCDYFAPGGAQKAVDDKARQRALAEALFKK